MTAPETVRARTTTDVLPPVVLMHGVGSSYEHNWVRPGWVEALSDGDVRTVLAARLPGHGPEAREANGPIVGAVLDAIGDAPIVDAVGFSAGGFGVLATAAAYPDRFRRIALIGVGDQMMANDITGRLALADALLAGARDRGSAAFRRVIERSGNDTMQVAEHIRTPRPSVTPEQLAAMSCEVLVVLGEDDPGAPATGLQAAIPRCEVLMLPEVGHHSIITDERCLAAVTEFLGRPS